MMTTTMKTTEVNKAAADNNNINNMSVDGVQTMPTLPHVHLVFRESTKEQFTYLTRLDLLALVLVLVEREMCVVVASSMPPQLPPLLDVIMIDIPSLPQQAMLPVCARPYYYVLNRHSLQDNVLYMPVSTNVH